MSIYGKSSQSPQTLESATRALEYIRKALDRSAIVAVTDAHGTIVHVNDKFCEISKYSHEELLGQNHRLINSGFHGRDFFVDMWKTITSGKVWEGEIRNRAKDGSFYWVYTTIVPFLDDNNKPYQYVSIRFEITRIKTAEDQLKDYARRLEVSNRELQDFASVAAHDLQEPLRKILTFGERLNVKSKGLLNEESQDYLQRMTSAALRMRSLINDVLAFSRVHTKNLPFSPVDLNSVMKGVLSDLEMRIEQTQARIDVAELPVIDADSAQMRQLFQNLLANSLKFHKPNEAPCIQVSAHVVDDMCELRVRDSGIGFEEKYLDKIFTIFQRLHGKQEYEGTGVGLAIVRRIVERHGGHITAQSQPDQGATFIIQLPIQNKRDYSK